MAQPQLVTFAGGDAGRWATTSMTVLRGDALPLVAAVSVHDRGEVVAASSWVLRGVTSNERCVERGERELLVASQAGLDRP